jgi:membrane protein YqaA with SNARE-associated domain
MTITDPTAMVVDILANMVVGAILGGLIGWYIGRGTRAAI